MAALTTIEQNRAPVSIRLLNKAGIVLEKLGLEPKPLSGLDLIETAKTRCRFNDLGDGECLEPLSRLLQSCHREARLNLIGKIALRADVLRILCNRLALEKDRQTYPEIATQKISGPLFIVGLPRSGTTLLHILLAVDPANRAPLTWEVMSPSPPNNAQHSNRIRAAARSLSMLRWLAPTFEQVHATGPELPQECVSLMSPTFMSDQFDTMYNVPSYRAWFLNQDMRPAYEFHRRFLQHLQLRQSAERWVLKAPAHMFTAQTLLSVYPDAQFVQIHREPLDAVASVSSLVTILRRVFSDAVDPVQVGRDATGYWSQALKNFMRVRDRLAQNRICDLRYEAIRHDALAAVRSVYEYFGWTLTPDVEKRMRTVLAQQSMPQNGLHRYDPSQFRLSGMNGFSEYRERFGLTGSDTRKEASEVAA